MWYDLLGREVWSPQIFPIAMHWLFLLWRPLHRLGLYHYNLKVQNKYCLLHNSPFKLKTNQLRNHTCWFERKKENEINPSTAKYKKEGAKSSDRLSEEPTRFTTIIPHPELSLPNSVQSNCIFIHQGHTKMMIIIINIAVTIDISTNIFITNMMMIKMTKIRRI